MSRITCVHHIYTLHHVYITFTSHPMCTSHLHSPHVYFTCTLHLCVHEVYIPPMCVHLHTTHLHSTPCVPHIYTSPIVYITFTPHPVCTSHFTPHPLCISHLHPTPCVHDVKWPDPLCSVSGILLRVNPNGGWGYLMSSHVCILRAVSWFRFPASFLVLLLSPLALSVLSFFYWWSILLTFPPENSPVLFVKK